MTKITTKTISSNITYQLHTKMSNALLATSAGPINSCWEAFPGALTDLHIKIMPLMLAADPWPKRLFID